jgi:hypothetical protein
MCFNACFLTTNIHARAGVKVDGWGLGFGQNWDEALDSDPCDNTSVATA